MGMDEISGLILRFPPKVEAQKGHRKAGMGYMVLGQQKLLFLHIFAYNLAHFILDFNDFKKHSFGKSTRNGLALSSGQYRLLIPLRLPGPCLSLILSQLRSVLMSVTTQMTRV